MKKILIHGSGHKATSWNKTIEYIKNNTDIFFPELSSILNGKEANYDNLYSSFVKYCNNIDEKLVLPIKCLNLCLVFKMLFLSFYQKHFLKLWLLIKRILLF